MRVGHNAINIISINHMKHIKAVLGISVLQAVGAGVVVWLWSFIMNNGEKWFGSGNPGMAGWIAIPLIFIIVATLSAGAVLGYPLYLAFHQKNWPKSVALIVLTLVWLGLISAGLVLTVIR